MDNIIKESDMDFVADNTFHIEDATFYKNNLRQKGIKSVEFIRARDNSLIFVEAKTTFPKPYDDPDTEEHERFDNEVNNVCEKFVHSLNMYASVKVGVTETQLQESFSPPNKVTITFVLVVKNHEDEWCRPIEVALIEALSSHLHMIKQIWQPKVSVMNHKTAIEQKLAVI